MLACIGSDEFIILVQSQQLEELASFAQLITETISELYQAQENEFLITSSLGNSQLPEHDHLLYQLFNHADTAMYTSKNNVKNKFTFYE